MDKAFSAGPMKEQFNWLFYTNFTKERFASNSLIFCLMFSVSSRRLITIEICWKLLIFIKESIKDRIIYPGNQGSTFHRHKTYKDHFHLYMCPLSWVWWSNIPKLHEDNFEQAIYWAEPIKCHNLHGICDCFHTFENPTVELRITYEILNW